MFQWCYKAKRIFLHYHRNSANNKNNNNNNTIRPNNKSTKRTNNNQQKDQIIINKKKRTCKFVNIALPADHRIKLKERDMKDKYLDLTRELNKNYGRSWGYLFQF